MRPFVRRVPRLRVFKGITGVLPIGSIALETRSSLVKLDRWYMSTISLERRCDHRPRCWIKLSWRPPSAKVNAPPTRND